MKAKTREEAIIAAYRAGDKIDAMEVKFGVGRSTLYHILRRSGTLPSRTKKVVAQSSRDETLAGFYELIAFQDRRIAELEDRNLELEAALAKSTNPPRKRGSRAG